MYKKSLQKLPFALFSCITLSSLQVYSHSKENSLQEALKNAQNALNSYIATVTPHEREKFIKYLAFYRSEGHYQAVTPAPSSLRDSLSPQSRQLFKQLVSFAKPLTLNPPALAGASSLSMQGHRYYQTILKILKTHNPISYNGFL